MAREVGTEGKLGGQADVRGVAGTWKDLTDNVNFMAGNLTGQVRNIADVTTAVANGDLSKKITVDVQGRDPRARRTRSTRWSTSSRSFAAEVTRVAREVGTEGKLGGQAEVPGVAGHVEGPDRQRQLHGRQPHEPGARHRQGRDRGRERRPASASSTVEAKGEIAALADTINSMIDTLATFADQVTTRGARGRRRGQARRPGRGAGRGRARGRT